MQLGMYAEYVMPSYKKISGRRCKKMKSSKIEIKH